MTLEAILDRLSPGEPPLRLGELAEMVGYSREALRIWAERGRIATVKLPIRGAHRRVPVEEARRLVEALGITTNANNAGKPKPASVFPIARRSASA